MAVERCVRNFYYNDGEDKEESFVGCGFVEGIRLESVAEGGLNFKEGNSTYSLSTLTWSDGRWNFSGLVQNAYYYNFKQAITFPELMSNGIGGSFTSVATEMMNEAKSRVALGETFNLNSLNYSQFTSKQQGRFGLSANGLHIVPYIEIYCRTNRYNAGDMSRYVEMGFNLMVAEANWDGNNSKWSIDYVYGGSFATLSVFVETSNYTEWETAAQNVINDAKNIYLSIGPQWGATQTGNVMQYGKSINYNGWIWVLYKDSHIQNLVNHPYIINLVAYGYSMGVRWNASGTIDPVDPFIDPDDPYDPIDPDDPEPGDPEPVDPSDPIPEPDIPDIGGSSVGIYKAFKPSSSQLSSIANKLWDPNAWDAIKQMFTNPMDAILGLAIIPVDPLTGASENVYLGRYNTEVAVPRIISDYVIIDCGTVPIKKFYGSYLDYDPYTRYTLHLPYVGELDLNADEIVGKNMQIKYHCNVITGDCTAYVLLNGNVAYLGSGNFIRQLPISQTDYTNIIQTAVSAVASIATAAVAGAGGAAVSGALDASARASDLAKISANNRVSSAVVGGTTSLLTDVMNSKYSYKHSGKVGQGAGQLSVQKPFITIIRPNLALPEGNDAASGSSLRLYTGYPSNKIVSLGSCHGFTQIESCRLSIPEATDEEIAEVYSLLKGGVIL